MKKVVAVLCVVGLANSYALAGTVSFGPNPLVEVDPAVSTEATFVVSIDFSDLLTEITSFRLIVGTNELAFAGVPAPGSGFLSFTNPQAFGLPPSLGGSFSNPAYAIAMDFQAINFPDFQGIVQQNPLPIEVATITFDAAGLAPGLYDILVSSDLDGFGNIFNSELNQPDGIRDDVLSGMGQVRVVPEPATLTLMGLAALGLIRRCRGAC